MANLLAHKVVGALPDPLEPDAVYAVRVGEGFDLYISDSTGSVAHRVNGMYQHVAVTQAQYDALDPPDPNTFYNIIAG